MIKLEIISKRIKVNRSPVFLVKLLFTELTWDFYRHKVFFLCFYKNFISGFFSFATETLLSDCVENFISWFSCCVFTKKNNMEEYFEDIPNLEYSSHSSDEDQSNNPSIKFWTQLQRTKRIYDGKIFHINKTFEDRL